MKKFARLAAIMAIASIVFSSCKSHEKCPAYGQIAPKHRSTSIKG